METIQRIKKDKGGNIERIYTGNYEFIFPESARPDNNSHIQEGDVFGFNCQGGGGTPFNPRVNIFKPGLSKPIYSEVVNIGCVQPSRVQ